MSENQTPQVGDVVTSKDGAVTREIRHIRGFRILVRQERRGKTEDFLCWSSTWDYWTRDGEVTRRKEEA